MLFNALFLALFLLKHCLKHHHHIFLQQMSGTTVVTFNMLFRVYQQIRQHILCHELEYETYC